MHVYVYRQKNIIANEWFWWQYEVNIFISGTYIVGLGKIQNLRGAGGKLSFGGGRKMFFIRCAKVIPLWCRMFLLLQLEGGGGTPFAPLPNTPVIYFLACIRGAYLVIIHTPVQLSRFNSKLIFWVAVSVIKVS